MPNTSTRKKQDLKSKYGGGYAIFSKDDRSRRRRRNVAPKEQQPKIYTASKKEALCPTATSFDDLASKLDYTYDSLATINVIFDSLYFTYTNSKDDIEQSKIHNRLGEMEKELLAAYDDLCLQINHLEKDISKMEEAFDKLKKSYTSNKNGSSDDECLSSPSFSFSSTSSPSSIFLESDFNFIDFSTPLLSSSSDKHFGEQLAAQEFETLPHQNYF